VALAIYALQPEEEVELKFKQSSQERNPGHPLQGVGSSIFGRQLERASGNCKVRAAKHCGQFR